MTRYTPETMTRRQLRSCYDRFFITTLFILGSTQLSARLLATAVRFLLPDLLASEFWYPILLVTVNDLSCYLPPLVIIPLLLHPLPAAEPLPRDTLDPWEWIQTAVMSLGVGYLFSMLTGLVVSALEGLSGMESSNFVDDFSTGLPFWLTLLTFALIAPVMEEYIFRGLLLDRLRCLGDISAVLLSALAFALFHLNLYQFAYALVLGALFACITLVTGSIRDTILLHMLINGSSVFMERLPEGLRVLPSYVILVCIAIGVPLFLKEVPHYHPEPGPLPFSRHEKRRACFRSPWFVLLLGVGVFFSVKAILG